MRPTLQSVGRDASATAGPSASKPHQPVTNLAPGVACRNEPRSCFLSQYGGGGHVLRGRSVKGETALVGTAGFLGESSAARRRTKSPLTAGIEMSYYFTAMAVGKLWGSRLASKQCLFQGILCAVSREAGFLSLLRSSFHKENRNDSSRQQAGFSSWEGREKMAAAGSRQQLSGCAASRPVLWEFIRRYRCVT